MTHPSDSESNDRGKLGGFLNEVINWDWREFVKNEKDPKFSGFQASVLALVRTASEGKLGAIKMAIDRVDGKVETPVRVIYPKIYYRYPFATSVALPTGDDVALALTDPNPDPLPEPPEAEPEDEPAAVLSLRATLKKMADAPRQVPLLIHQAKKKIEKEPEEADGEAIEDKAPMVKSVIAANLLMLANEKQSFEAITEVFDQIDGKLVETIRILGDDIHLSQYSLIAPYGAEKNADGVYEMIEPQVTDVWKEKLGAK